MILWHYLAHNSYDRQIAKAKRLDALAAYTLTELQKLQKERWPRLDLQISRSPLSLTVLFRQANPKIVAKYSLSNDRIKVNGEDRYYSHVFLMDHVKKPLIDQLIKDLAAPDAFEIAVPASRLAETAEELLAPELLAEAALEAETAPDLSVLGEIPVSGRGFQ